MSTEPIAPISPSAERATEHVAPPTSRRISSLFSRLSAVDLYPLFILFLSLFAIAPMLQPGYQWGAHDARHSVYFLFEFDRGIQDGALLPRWQPDFAFGYGYPFFNIYGPLAFYVGEVFYLLGLGFVGSVKAVFALSIAASGLTIYFFVKRVLAARDTSDHLSLQVGPWRQRHSQKQLSLRGASAASDEAIPNVIQGGDCFGLNGGPRNDKVQERATSPSNPALVAAVAYMFIPYRLVDVYVRAGLAESSAYVFIPLVLWGVWATLHQPRWTNLLGLALAYAALLLTHPLSALLLTLLLLFLIAALSLAQLAESYPLRSLWRRSLLPALAHLVRMLLPTGAGLALGLGLSAFFALPAMIENRFVRVDQWYGGRYAWGGDFVEFFQLFSPRWGFGASVPGPNDEVSFQLGIVPVVLALLAVAGLLRAGARRHLGHGGWRLALFFAVLVAVVVFLMLGVSAPVWDVLPLVRLAQFPWRLLTLTTFSLAFLCGVAACGRADRPPLPVAGTRQRPVDAATLILVALLVLAGLPYARADMTRRAVSLAGLMRFQQSSDEMTGSTAWVREIPAWSSLADYYIAGEPLTSKVDFDSLYRQPGRPHARTLDLRAHRELVEYSAERPILMTFNTFYYPGWHAYLLDAGTGAVIDELPIALRGELGLMTVRLPAGVGRVLLQFEDTPLRQLATGASLVSLLAAGLIALVGVLLDRRGFTPRAKDEPPAGQVL
ncbi:MAG: hypothetical protein JXA93_22045 [Anaerolineae bacterium]|nr:hypothetical protein [Anaerolineae bacterium]